MSANSPDELERFADELEAAQYRARRRPANGAPAFLTLDELRRLEAIVVDEAAPEAERAEAARRLEAELGLRAGLMGAAGLELAESFGQVAHALDAIGGSFRGLGHVLELVLEELREGLTAAEAGRVARLVAAGVAELDAIVRVTQASAARRPIVRRSRRRPWGSRLVVKGWRS